jgi:hypothetical protein
MAFWQKLFKRDGFAAGTASDAEELALLHRDNRIHPRYLLPSVGLLRFQLESGLVGEVRDVSYGGMAVRFDFGRESMKAPPLMGEVIGDLGAFDLAVRCRMTTVRIMPLDGNAAMIGLAFKHDHAASLLFLREVVEPLRWANTFVELAKDASAERYRAPEWRVFRGEGPTDLAMRVNAAGVVDEMMLTFRLGRAYREVTLQNGALKTGIGQGRGDHPTRQGELMTTSPASDAQTLRLAGIILASTPSPAREQLAPVVARIEGRLRASPPRLIEDDVA